MRAAFIRRLGSVEEIVYGELPVPSIDARQVLVRVQAVAVNLVDTYVRAGTYATPLTFPFVIGRDVVGTVEALGSQVDHFALGQRVWCNSLGHQGRQGSFAEFAAVDQDRLYPLPDGVDPVAAVACFHPAATAFTGLVHHAGGVRAGETVVVIGAAGSVGSAVVRFASSMGGSVIAVARVEDEAWCRSCGASQVFDYRSASAAAILGPGSVDLYWDASGQNNLAEAVELLRLGGRIVVIAGRRESAFNTWPLYVKNGRVLGFAISNASIAQLGEAASAINGMLSDGSVSMRIASILPLSEAREAHRLVEGRSVRGRVVLTV
jgi:NADPH:quinone reductase-like Zn-dependent oxidoreductase